MVLLPKLTIKLIAQRFWKLKQRVMKRALEREPIGMIVADKGAYVKFIDFTHIYCRLVANIYFMNKSDH